MGKQKGTLEQSINGTIWLSAASMIDYAINLMITAVLARLLTATDYGEVSAITVLVGFADIFWQIGVSQALIQKRDLQKKDIATGFYLNTALCMLVFAALVFFADFWCSVFSINSAKMLRVYAMVYIFNGIMAIPTALLQRELKFKITAAIGVLTHVIYGVAVVILAFCGFGPWALVIGMLIRYGSKALMTIVSQRACYDFRLFNKQSMKELLNFGGGFTISKIFNYLANNGDYFVINKTLGKIQLGNYQKSYNLMMYPTNLIGSNLESIFFPVFSKEQSNKEKLGRAYISANVFIALLTVPISIVAYSIAEPLVIFFLSDKWVSIVPAFKIMIIGLYFRTAYKLGIALLKGQGKVYHNAVIQAVYALLVVVGAYLGHFKGLEGVALGVTIAFTTNYFMLLFANSYFIGFKLRVFARDMIVPVIYGGVVVCLLPIIQKLWAIPSSSFIKCVVCTLIVFPIYFGMVILTAKKLLSSETNTVVDKAFTTLGKKLLKKKK